MGLFDFYSIQQCTKDELLCSESYKGIIKIISSSIDNEYKQFTYCVCDSV